MKTNTIVITLAALLLAAGVYWYFFTGSGNQAPLTSVPEASSAEVRFETLQSRLPVSFDTSVFSDVRFKSLQDLTQPIQSEPIGRSDPFAPIGAQSPAPATPPAK